MMITTCLFVAPLVLAQELDVTDPIRHEAGPQDPPALGPAQGTTPPAIIEFGPYTHIQINVDGDGNNIVGDAANEPSMAVDPTAPNRMAGGWRQFGSITSNFRQAGYSYSRDGGRTWAPEQIIEPELFRSDPVLGSGPDGTFYYLTLHVSQQNDFFCDVFTSNDHGATWGNKAFAFGGDKAWFVIDATGGPGHGNFYQPWNTAGNMYFPNQFNRSIDAPDAWEDPVEYDPDGDPPARPVFGILDVGPDGSVYVAGSRNSSNTGTFWVVKSEDAQTEAIPSFTQHVQVDLGGNLRLSTGPNPAGLLGQVEIKVDKSGGATNGNVYVVGSVEPVGGSGDPMNIHFIRSTDGGLNWSVPQRLNDDPVFGSEAWQWMGTMGLAPNGRIDVIWNDTRNFPGSDNMNELFYTFSTDGGDTWAPNIQLSPSWNSHIGWPNQNKIGDYYQVRSDNVGAHVIWAATFNGEQDVYYLRIGDYDCNGNDIGDADDIANATSGDCNANGIPDECEIAAGELPDDNDNGIPDDCETCLGDFDGSGEVGFTDLLTLLGSWGPCPGCPADLNGSGDVAFDDLLVLLAAWGECSG